MKPKFRLGRRNLLDPAFGLGCLVVSGLQPVFSAQIYWDGNPTSTWGDAANWSTAANAATPDPALPPGAADVAIFNIDTVDGDTVATLNAAQAAQGLVFNNTGSTTIRAAATAQILTVGADGVVVDAAAGPVTIGGAPVDETTTHQLNVSLGQTQTWHNASANPLVLLNPIASAGAMGTGAGLTKTGPGTLWFNSVLNTHTINGTLDIQGGVVQTSGDLFTGGLTGTGVLENGGPNNKWFFVNSPNNQTFGGTIRNGAARLGLVKRGVGTLTLPGAHGPALDNFAVENGRVILPSGSSLAVGGSGFGSLHVGNTGNAANNGVMEINGATVTAARTNNPGFAVGSGNNGRGFVSMTGGTLNVTEQLKVGNGSTAGQEAHAGFRLDSGNVTSGSWLVVGLNNDRALLTQNGGSIQVSSNRMTIGAGGNGSIGAVNLNGGTFDVAAGGNTGIFLGENGTGALNISGSAAVTLATNGGANSGTMQFAGNASSLSGHLNLRGGSLSAFAVTKGASTATGVYRFNFHGGTLKAQGNNANFFADLANTDAYVYAGGGTIDNQGHNITITESLRAPTGNGVSATGLTVSGGGYLFPPLVTVTGGGGTGATARATIDAGGNLTGIEITNPGIDYTEPPTFAVIGGGAGNTGSVGGAATLVPNTAGALTFTGSGTTTLAGTANGFAGTIQVAAGKLGLGGTYNVGVNAAAGAGVVVADPAGAVGSLSLPSLTLGNGGSLTFDTAGGTSSDLLTVTNAGGFSFGSTLDIVLLDSATGSPATPGTYTLVAYNGGFTGNIANLSVTNPRIGFDYNFSATGSAIVVEVVSTDTDGDGMTDAYEIANGLDPNDDGTIGETSPGAKDGPNGALGNIDGDFATNFEEFLAGTAANDPNDDPLNTDNDGLLDSWEIANFGSIAAQSGSDDFDGDFDTNLLEFTNGTDPAAAASFSDEDEDGLGDGWEIHFFGDIETSDGTIDSDTDGFTDLEEYANGTDPTDPDFSPAFAKPKHRWSFSGNLEDSVGDSDATIVDGATSNTNPATVSATAVTLTGGAKGDSQWVRLGSNLLPKKNTPVTIELWATPLGVQNWSRIFDFHSGTGENLFMSWTMGTAANTDRVEWRDGALITVDNTNPYFVGDKHHIVMTIEPNPSAPGSSVVRWWSAPALGEIGGDELGPPRGTFAVANSLAFFNDAINALGHSPWPDNTANAEYDEVRIWDGAVKQWALEGFHTAGPDSIVQADTDNDELPDAFEMFYFGHLDHGPDDDPDNDQSTNLEELLANSDPGDPFSSPNDSDGDGLPDAWEIEHFGSIDLYDGFDDPDGDDAFNEEELAAGTDPNDYFSFPDEDGDGMSDPWEIINLVGGMDDDGTGDDDGDKFTSLQEFLAQSNPADPLDPGVPNGDADGDGLPDRWEVEHFDPFTLADQSGGDDPDGDGFDNAAEFLASSDPNDPASTPSDVNGDGETDMVLHLDMTALGGGIQDADGEATSFTHRLPNTGTAIPVPDPNLDLDTDAGTLAITTSTSDINGQVNMAQLEALGIPLATLGFTGSEDFRIRAHYLDIPALAGFDQIGAYVGTSSTAVTRASVIGGTHQALAVHTNGNNDSSAVFGAANTAGAPGSDLIVVIERIGGQWAMRVNGNTVTPGAQPAFLNGTADLQAGVFVLDGGVATPVHKTAQLDSFTIVRFGVAAGGDSDSDGMDDTWEMAWFGNTDRDGTGDFDGDGQSDLAEFAFNSNPTSGSSLPAVQSALADTNANAQRELTLTVPVRAGATFAADVDGSQIATVDGITYRIRGSLDLAAFASAVTHVSMASSGNPDYELHTFRLDASDGLGGKGFLQATATPPQQP